MAQKFDYATIISNKIPMIQKKNANMIQISPAKQQYFTNTSTYLDIFQTKQKYGTITGFPLKIFQALFSL